MSEFWKRKMRTFFSMFDVDKDGVMSKDDWTWMAIPRVENAKKELEDNLTTEFANVWDQFMKHNETGDKNTMTIEMFTELMVKLRHDPDLIKHFSHMIEGLFYMTDTNGDGYLQEDEYERIIAQCGVEDTSFTKEAFKAIDANGDGKVSLQEHINAFFSFLFSEDENDKRKLFFGPLVD